MLRNFFRHIWSEHESVLCSKNVLVRCETILSPERKRLSFKPEAGKKIKPQQNSNKKMGICQEGPLQDIPAPGRVVFLGRSILNNNYDSKTTVVRCLLFLT